jgi:hypothetical protein
MTEWSALSDNQRLVLTALDVAGNSSTPQQLARQADELALAWWGRTGPPWQGLSRTVASLIRHGLAARRVVGRVIYYEITNDGRHALRIPGRP